MPVKEARRIARCARKLAWRYTFAVLFVGLAAPISGADAAELSASNSATPTQHAYTNRLIDSANPYLLLHAHNPVDWYPWGPEALEKAKRENRPIFLSIGYSTCYWCHVAERTLFSSPQIAELMNRWFVNIKVDREERPDLDAIYMLATGLITGGAGGWPNNVFLTPDLEPFYAGGYFPPEDDESGRPGFTSVLTAIHDEWTANPERMKQRAAGVTEVLRQRQAKMLANPQASVDPQQWLARTRESILKRFDTAHGGLGSARQTTKFPQSPVLAVMLTDLERNNDPDALRFLTDTLDAMAYGALYDQLGGGFHRYSTERTWSIPHFEKMLYDNAQLLGLYARAWQHSQEPQYRRIALGTRDYLRDRMLSPEGGFYTAEDAAVGGDEGASYVWSQSEIGVLLGASAADFWCTYALTPMPDQTDPTNPETAPGVLRVRQREASNTATVEHEIASLVTQTRTLLAAREARPQPARDEKLLVGWNGLAIDAFVVSGEVFHDPDDIANAKRAGERIWDLAWDARKDQLSHQIFRGRVQGSAFLEDYALLGRGFLSLYRATGEELWLQRARTLADALLRRFDANGDGVLTSTSEGDTLIVAPVEEGDGAYPSGTSAAVDLLARLGRATNDQRYADAAARLARQASDHPEQWPALVAAASANDLGREASGTDQPASETARHVRASATSRSSGRYREIVITLDIEPGYHVNANPASFDFLIATSVTFGDVHPMEVRYPAPTSFKPSFAPDTLNVYEGTVQLVAKLDDGEINGLHALSAAVNTQACTETVCLPPARIVLTIRLDTTQRR
jgi:uncharacterized protein YyaL (SSP411 family)